MFCLKTSWLRLVLRTRQCGFKENDDLNAAINICQVALGG